MITSIGSLLGVLFVMVWLCVTRRMMLLHWRLVFFSSLCQLIVSVVLLAEWPFVTSKDNAHASVWCNFQGFVLSMFQIAGELWVLAIAFRLHRLVSSKPNLHLRSELIFHAIVWPVSAFPASIPFFNDDDDFLYAPLASGYCWLAPSDGMARLLLFYLPQFFVITVMVALYIRVVWVLRNPIKQYAEAFSQSMRHKPIVDEGTRHKKKKNHKANTTEPTTPSSPIPVVTSPISVPISGSFQSDGLPPLSLPPLEPFDSLNASAQHPPVEYTQPHPDVPHTPPDHSSSGSSDAETPQQPSLLPPESPRLMCPTAQDRARLKRTLRAVKQLALYPVALLLSWTPCMVCRIIEVISGAEDGVTSLVVAWTNNIAGIFFFLACIFTGGVIEDIRLAWRGHGIMCFCWCICGRSSTETLALLSTN
ncbi:hypothetical protein Pelo_11142 [Pelomyxa schiedti]|nr:hypothetical protein Pelo_11142 [Pelomyxa schiedti]